jgi:6-phosphofructokinase 1
MNAATRQAVRFCHNRGHLPIGIHNGFEGLLDDNVTELSWLRVDTWTTRGGSELGTNRTLPSEDLGQVAAGFQRHSLDALLIIGGFEAYHSVMIMEQARAAYPSFQIPMIHLPATISVCWTFTCQGSLTDPSRTTCPSQTSRSEATPH